NEEISPVAQTPKQQALERAIVEDAQVHAKRLNVDWQTLLRTPRGLACAFLAVNRIAGGDFYNVSEDEIYEPGATAERIPSNVFVFDAQTHFLQDCIAPGIDFRSSPFLKDVGARIGRLHGAEHGQTSDYGFLTYMKEVFLDSDTEVAVVSGGPD